MAIGIESFFIKSFGSLFKRLNKNKVNRSQARRQIRNYILWLNPGSGNSPTDEEIWKEIGEDSARWAEQGVITPVIWDDLHKGLAQLAPYSRASLTERAAAQDDIYNILIDELDSAGTPDLLTRSWREFWRLKFSYKKRRADRSRRRGTNHSGQQPESSVGS